MSWSNDVVLEFLELYRREQHLWDPKHPLNRFRKENNDAWLRIQSSLSINCSVVDLKKKKESLMTSFRMHLNKKRKSQGGYCTTWFAFPLMESFLSGKYECDSTNQLDQEFYSNGGAYDTESTMPEHNINRSVVTDKRQNKVTSIPQTNQMKAKVNSNNNSEFNFTKKQMDDNMSYLKRPVDENREMDEYELYGQLLAKKLRKLNEHQRDVAMHDIDNIMFRAKMQSGSSQARSRSTTPTSVPRKVKSPIFIVTQQNSQQYEDENTPYQDHMQPQAP